MYKTILIGDMAHGANDIYVHNPIYGNTVNPSLLNKISEYYKIQYPLLLYKKIYIVAEGVQHFHKIQIENNDFGIDSETNTIEGLLLRLLDGLRGVLLVPQIRQQIYPRCNYVLRYSNLYDNPDISQEIKDNMRKFIEIFSDPNFESYRENKQKYSEPFIIFYNICVNIKNYLKNINPDNPRIEIITNIIKIYQNIMIEIINANRNIISDPELVQKNEQLYGLVLQIRDSYVSEKIINARQQNLLTCVIMGGNHINNIMHFIGYENIAILNMQVGGYENDKYYKQKYLKYKLKYKELQLQMGGGRILKKLKQI